MKNLVKFVDPNGSAVFIDPETVVGVRPSLKHKYVGGGRVEDVPTNGTWIDRKDGLGPVLVRGPSATVYAMLSGESSEVKGD